MNASVRIARQGQPSDAGRRQAGGAQQPIILVSGATGTVGRHLVSELMDGGAAVRALTRNASRSAFPDGVDVVEGDLTKPETLKHAIAGATGLHLITVDGDGFEPLQTGPAIVELATKAGVQRVTVLWNGEPGSMEQAVEASDLAWTHLRPQEFMANSLEWVESIRTDGVVRAYGPRLSAAVHERDIAAVAARALMEDGHAGQTYTITGPEALTVPEKVRIIGAALGIDLQLIPYTREEAREQMRATGASDNAIDFVLDWHANPPEEGYTVVPTVEQVTGRRPRTFAEWAAEHVGQFQQAHLIQ